MLKRICVRIRRSSFVEIVWFSLQHLFNRLFLPRTFRTKPNLALRRELLKNGLVRVCQLDEDVVLELRGVLQEQIDKFNERPCGEDLRVWGMESYIPSWRSLSEEVVEITSGLVGARWEIATVMGNVVPPEPSSLGSGGGWHRDSNAPQYKIMILLSDVHSVNDGAFVYFPGSHRFAKVMRTFNSNRRWRTFLNRWDEEGLPWRQSNACAALGDAGEVLLFDGALVHRGSPNTGLKIRQAITCYLYPHSKAPTYPMRGNLEAPPHPTHAPQARPL